MNRAIALTTAVAILWFPTVSSANELERRRDQQSVRADLPEVGHPTFLSPHASPIAITGDHVFVVNTPSDTVDVIAISSNRIVHRIPVGVDPVSVAVRPDGNEVWVSNHVSDTVSVIDVIPSSRTYLHVVATIQDIDPETKATRFDEPVGIAFADNKKAYVALSSENRIAVIDVAARKVTKRLFLTAQDPRDIVVRGDRLYVIPFESNNRTQLSGGQPPMDGDLVTFDAHQHSVANNNVLSLGAVVDIVKHPEVPDRDLYVYDTNTDKIVQVVEDLGTLLYGLTVDSQGNVYVAQTDARNEVNGRSGTKKHGLAQLENRAFLNQITAVPFANGKYQKPTRIELEPLPPEHPEPGTALATPFAIQVSEDDSTLVATAAGSDKVFTVDTATGNVLGSVKVDAVPRGLALIHDNDGQLKGGWVFNAVENSVLSLDLSDRSHPVVKKRIALDDPTHPVVKRGRIAFNTAAASTTETFSCASCHPDGHTDQLLWVLKTPIVTGGDQIMPRSTMPIRGLRDTAPFHWDGIPGDPYGGNNSANVHGNVEPNAELDVPESTTRHLIDGGLASTMAMVGHEGKNDEGKSGRLSAQQRDDMATFLLSVPYPPAQRRAYTNTVSDRALDGFKLFHIDGDHQGGPTPNVCGDCHRMPYWVSTNTPGSGMDAPTWRGAYDRWLILPQGRLNIISFDFFRNITEIGIPERRLWQFSWAGRRRFDPVWDMVLEGSTGYSGAFARQFTLDPATADDTATVELLHDLEQAAEEGAVVLEVDGVLLGDNDSTSVSLKYDGSGSYVCNETRTAYPTERLIALASTKAFVGTFSARHGNAADVDHPQPAIWTLGPIEQQRGHQDFPVLHPGRRQMTISGRHVSEDANIVVNGRRTDGSVSIDGETLTITLETLPEKGMHLIQLQNPGGQFSNDFIFHIVDNADDARELKQRINARRTNQQIALSDAVNRGDRDAVERALAAGANINGRRPREGSTAFSNAALRGNVEMVKYLIDKGARVSRANEDGNTPLHVAAFMCREEVVRLLLEHGATPAVENDRGETVVDVVSGEWSDGLAGFYTGIGRAIGMPVDLEQIQQDRPRMAELLREAKDD